MDNQILAYCALRLQKTYSMDAGRSYRAAKLVELGAIAPRKSNPGLFRVTSQESATRHYAINTETFRCQCDDWQKHQDKENSFVCKHILACLLWMKYFAELNRRTEATLTPAQKFDAFIESLGIKKLEVVK